MCVVIFIYLCFLFCQVADFFFRKPKMPLLYKTVGIQLLTVLPLVLFTVDFNTQVARDFTRCWSRRPQMWFELTDSQRNLVENIYNWMVSTVQEQWWLHYTDVIMNAMASQITAIFNVFLTVGSGVDQRKHQSSASLAFVRGIHRWPANSPHKRPVTRKMFPLHADVIMQATISGVFPRALKSRSS